MIFLDANIIIRYLSWDDAPKAKKCESLFKKVAEGKINLYTTTLVIAEVVWVLEKVYKFSRKKIAEHIQMILNTPNIELDEKDILRTATGLYELKKLDFIDSYNAVSMQAKKINSIYSYDTHFDDIPPIRRIEP